MKITKRQLRRIIKESLNEALPPHLQKHFRDDGSSVRDPEWEDVTPAGYGPDDEQADPRAMELESLINGWISQPITVEFVRGTSYMVKGVEPAMIPEVTEEVEEFGGSVQAEISSGTTPGLKDLNIML